MTRSIPICTPHRTFASKMHTVSLWKISGINSVKSRPIARGRNAVSEPFQRSNNTECSVLFGHPNPPPFPESNCDRAASLESDRNNQKYASSPNHHSPTISDQTRYRNVAPHEHSSRPIEAGFDPISPSMPLLFP